MIYRDTIYCVGNNRVTIQSAHEKAHLGGLSGSGGIPVSDSKVLEVQRAGGARGRHRETAVPVHAADQGHARWNAAADTGSGKPAAGPASQRSGTDQPAGIARVREAGTGNGRPARGLAGSDAKGRAGREPVGNASSRAVAIGRAEVSCRPAKIAPGETSSIESDSDWNQNGESWMKHLR
jgi:hypothetical protein